MTLKDDRSKVRQTLAAYTYVYAFMYTYIYIFIYL